MTILNVNEAVTIISGGGANRSPSRSSENPIAVASVSAVDADGTPVFYSIAGGTDSAFFAVDPLGGRLSLVEGADSGRRAIPTGTMSTR